MVDSVRCIDGRAQQLTRCGWRWVIALATMWAMLVIAVAHVTGWL